MLCFTCKAQTPVVENLSSFENMNYLFARIAPKLTINKELYKESLYITIYQLSDSKATPENFFDGYDGTLASFIVSIIPDGDYYTRSKLYKIEGFLNPKILEVKETQYPNFSIKVEYGKDNKRKVKSFEFTGVK